MPVKHLDLWIYGMDCAEEVAVLKNEVGSLALLFSCFSPERRPQSDRNPVLCCAPLSALDPP
jgi:hypothetical protein